MWNIFLMYGSDLGPHGTFFLHGNTEKQDKKSRLLYLLLRNKKKNGKKKKK